MRITRKFNALVACLAMVTCGLGLEISLPDGASSTATCSDTGTSIYIDSASYGCASISLCGSGNSSCVLTTQISQVIRLYCQGKEICTLPPQAELLKSKPCQSGMNYLNVSWHCQNFTEMVLPENHAHTIECNGSGVVVFHILYWQGFTVENNTKLSGGNSSSHALSVGSANSTLNVTGSNATLYNVTGSNITLHNVTGSNATLHNQTALNNHTVPNNETIRSNSTSFNFSVPLHDVPIWGFETGCSGKNVCHLDTLSFSNPYPGILSKKSIVLKASCQPVNSGYKEWTSWKACPVDCGVLHYPTRRRTCFNPTTTTGGADCSGRMSATKSTACSKPCAGYNHTVCENQTINLTCQDGTFINFDKVYYGRQSATICTASGLLSNCTPSTEIEEYNNIRAYERCEMRTNCTLVASNDTFKDPCPGNSKYLSVVYRCTPVVQRIFCDEDNAKISCPKGKVLVLHSPVKYGRESQSVCVVPDKMKNCTLTNVPKINRYCNSGLSCNVDRVTSDELNVMTCDDVSKYIMFHYSCQPKHGIYYMWGSWGSCEACGLHAKRSRHRKLNPGDGNLYNGLHGGNSLTQRKICYKPCQEHNITMCGSQNATINCPKYGKYLTVLEVRSVFYGRTEANVCSSGVTNTNCTSPKTTKAEVMKHCQGRNQCLLDNPTTFLKDPCVNNSKYFNMTYLCQPVYSYSNSENKQVVSKNISCYDNMVIIVHDAAWKSSRCPKGQPDTFKKVKGWCDGKKTCSFGNSIGNLGDPCPKNTKTFSMWYSCQAARGGLDTEWGPWSNCTVCGLYSMKERRKRCLKPVTHTSGSHCPLVLQKENCNKPCPVDKLRIPRSMFGVVLGQPLKVQWTMYMGTNVTAIFSWGDNSTNTTLQGLQANATNHLTMVSYHNYTEEGDYIIRLYADNVVNNQSITRNAYVQVKLVGLNLSAPLYLLKNEQGLFNISLDVVSRAPPNVRWEYGDGTVVETTNFSSCHSYSNPGNYSIKVKASNRVSNLQISRTIIEIQENITGLRLSERIYNVSLNNVFNSTLLWTTGSHLFVYINFSDNSSAWHYVTLRNPVLGGMLLTHTFKNVGIFRMFVSARNRVSRSVDTSGYVIVETPIQGFNASIVCQRRFKDCFQDDGILVRFEITNGSNPHLKIDFSDNTTLLREGVMRFQFTHKYNGYGLFVAEVLAYNNASRQSYKKNLNILRLSSLKDLQITCNETINLGNDTTCELLIGEGTAYECTIGFGDGAFRNFPYETLPSVIIHNYATYGIYNILMTCNNTLGTQTALYTTVVSGPTLGMSLRNNGPRLHGEVVVFSVGILNPMPRSCFMLDTGDGVKRVYGDNICSKVNFGMPDVSPVHKVFTYNHTYSKSGLFKAILNGTGNFIVESVSSLIAITEKPCNIFNALLRNIGSEVGSAIRIFKSKEFVIRSKYSIKCEEAVGAVLEWDIQKKESGNSFVHSLKMTTLTSQLVIPPRTLDYGVYKVKLTITLSGINGIWTASEGYIEVVKTPLIVVIMQGTGIRRNAKSVIQLDGSQSHDPDRVQGIRSTLQFSWYCYLYNNISNLFLTNTPLTSINDVIAKNNLTSRISCNTYSVSGSGDKSSSITLNPQLIEKKGVLIVELHVREGNRHARRETAVQLVNVTVPVLYVSCQQNCQEKVNPTDVLSFSGNCTEHCSNNITKLWSLFSKNTATGKWAPVTGLQSKTLSDVSGFSLVLKQHSLGSGTTFVVRLTAWGTNGTFEGFTEYEFITSIPPYGGECTVFPSEGIAIDTLFSFKCYNWTIETTPALYKFGYKEVYTDLKNILYSTGETGTSLNLPAGHPRKNSDLGLTVMIVDVLGVYTEIDMSIRVFPRVMKRTELQKLVLKQDSVLDVYINTGNVHSASELVSGVLSILNYEAIQEHSTKNVTSEHVTLRKEVRSSIIVKMCTVPTQTLEAIKQVSVTIAAAAEIRSEVEVHAQTNGTLKLEEMAIVLFNRSRQDIGLKTITEAAKDLVTAGSNIMRSAAYVADYSRQEIELTTNRKKSQEVVNKNMKIFDFIAQAVFNKHLLGQDDIVIQTTSTGAAYRRVHPRNIGKKPISVGGAEVKLPSAEILLEHERLKHTDVQMLLIPENPFTWDKTSPRIRSSIANVKIKDDLGNTLRIANLTQDIELSISGVTSSPNQNAPQFYKKADNATMQYHSFSYTQEGESINLGIKPVNTSDTFAAYVKYGGRPTEVDFDLMRTFPNFSSCKIDEDQKHYNCSEDPFTIFISSDYLELHGVYYVGIKYVKMERKQELKSRQRRDCEPGRRAKRSCIKYKDPPPTLPGNGMYGSFSRDYDRFADRNYTIGTESVGCRYWDSAINSWTTSGCKVGRRRKSSRHLSCRCNHMTSFGGSFLVAPNPIDLDKVWIGFTNPEKNIAIIVTMSSVFLLYILVLIWSRRADKRDVLEHTGIVMMISESDFSNSYNYMVTISTGQWHNAGTTANVYVTFAGERGNSGNVPLSKATKVQFTRGSKIEIAVCLPKPLGSLLYLHIWHDNEGSNPSWFLHDVNIRDTQTGEHWNFVCDKWIAVENEDCRTDVILYVASPSDLNSYKRIFISKTSTDLYDGHLWISVVAKPPTTNFTRVQRCSCCLSVLFSSMVVNCMFYNLDNKPDTSIIMVGPLKVSIRQLVIGIQSGLIIFPVNLLLAVLFRKSMQSDSLEASGGKLMQNLRPGPFMYFYTECFETSNKSLKNRCHDFFCGGFLYYFSWCLCSIVVVASAVVTLMYTFQWEKETSEKWLVSFFTSFVQDAFVIQPIKVAALAAFVAFIIKVTKNRKKSNYKTLGNAEEFDSGVNSAESNTTCTKSNQTGLPPNRNVLENARKLRIKQINTYNVVKDIVCYFLFLLLLMAYAYGHKDPLSYTLTKEMMDLSRPTLGTRKATYWAWLSKRVIPMVFVAPWYNGQKAGKNEAGFISNRASYVVGMARLRQLRIRKDACAVYKPMSGITVECYDAYSYASEDNDYYKPEWQPLDPGTNRNNVSLEVCPIHWRYQDAATLKGLPIWGETKLYQGGGYVAELGYYPAKAYSVLSELFDHHWIDHRTRAIFVEFAIYNAQKNLFSMVTLLVEFLPMGGMIPFSKIDTFRIYRYLTTFSIFIMASEIIIALVMLILSYLVLKRIYKEGKQFFKFFWNWVDTFQALFGLVSVALYFVKMDNLNRAMKDLNENPFVFVNFQFAILWNDIDGFLVAAVVFLTTIKFLRLLKYQSYIKLLEHVFSRFSTNMSWFMVEFTMWFMPFVMFANLCFGEQLYDFHTIISSFQATLNALLGGTYYYDLQAADRIMGPILYVGFNILLVFILLNIFISIINSSFERNVDDEFTKETEPQLMMFISEKIGLIFGFKVMEPLGKDTETFSQHSLHSEVTSLDGSKAIPYQRLEDQGELEEKMKRFSSFVARILLLEDIETTLYDLVILRKGGGKLENRFHELIRFAAKQ